jgi:hypothetical protein
MTLAAKLAFVTDTLALPVPIGYYYASGVGGARAT